MIQYSTLIHSDPGHAKIDKLRENEAKREETEIEPGQKRVISHILI